MTTGLDAMFGPTAERSIADAAERDDSVAELALSTGERHRFDRPLLIGRLPGSLSVRPAAEGRALGATDHVGIEPIRVDNRMLSRRHACVSPVGRRVSVVDLGSTNGTVVVAPGRVPIVCRPGELVLAERGWWIEFAGVVWATIEPSAGGLEAHRPIFPAAA